jgi:alpha-1,6-mannosyltransferase
VTRPGSAAAFWGLGAVLAALTVTGASQLPPGELELGGAAIGRFVALELVAGAVWAWVCFLALRAPPRRALPGVLVLALAMRLIPLLGPPLLSSDVYRYVWDGRVQAAGVNPYRYRPADPALAFLRDRDVYPYINRAIEAPTIYPPAAQGLFRLAAAVSPGVTGMKIVMVIAEGIAGAFLLALLRRAGLPAARLAIYAWAPLPVWEFAGDGHVDAASLAWIGAALLAAATGRRLLAGVALAGGGLTKVLPLAIAPALWRRWDWRLPLAAVAAVVAAYLPYIGAGWRVLGYLPGYGSEEGLENGAGVLWLRLLALAWTLPRWVSVAWFVLGAAVLLGSALWAAWRALPADGAGRTRAIGRRALLLAGTAMLVVTPHYSWYLCWIAYLAALCAEPWSLWLTGLAPLLYLDPQHDRVLWPALVFVPAAVLAVRSLHRSTP